VQDSVQARAIAVSDFVASAAAAAEFFPNATADFLARVGSNFLTYGAGFDYRCLQVFYSMTASV
jgi:hypothetical protein